VGKISQIITGQPVYLDANVFIYALEAYPEFIPAITELFSLIDSGKLYAVTSQLTLAETLVKPFRDSNIHLQQAYQASLQNSDFLHVIEINLTLLIEAARLRASHSQLRLPDAIHLATAYAHHCGTLVTNDKRLKGMPGINILLLQES
jgi:predicted nucleic acid-binding protein